MNLVRSELAKLGTTNTWWIFALISVPLWAITLFFNYLQTQFLVNPQVEGAPPDQAEAIEAISEPVNIAANLYTNGQYFGVLIVMLLGVIIVTSEFFHQTATTTFLTTPRRTSVIVAKLVAAGIVGIVFWLVTTAVNLVVTPLILANFDLSAQLGESGVWQAIGLNGLAYLLWTIFGIGFGVLIRSQIGATVTAILLYFAGYIGAAIFFSTLAGRFGDWFNDLQLLVPSLASQLMVAGTELPGNPPRWAGAAVMLGYALVTGVVGTLLVRRRDIS